MSPLRLALHLSVAALLVPGAALGQSPEQPTAAVQAEALSIRFCVAEESLPRSARGGAPWGYEVEIARALAAEMGTEARFVWLPSHHDRIEQEVREGRCDVASGVLAAEVPLADSPVLGGLALTRRYYHAGYVLVRRRDAPPLPTLAAAGETRIAVEGESIVNYTLRQRGHRVHVLFDQKGVLRALEEGRASYGYLWAPRAAWAIRDRKQLVIAPEFESPDRWPFALAVRREDTELRRRLNEAIERLQSQGRIAAILSEYGLP